MNLWLITRDYCIIISGGEQGKLASLGKIFVKSSIHAVFRRGESCIRPFSLTSEGEYKIRPYGKLSAFELLTGIIRPDQTVQRHHYHAM